MTTEQRNHRQHIIRNATVIISCQLKMLFKSTPELLQNPEVDEIKQTIFDKLKEIEDTLLV